MLGFVLAVDTPFFFLSLFFLFSDSLMALLAGLAARLRLFL